MPGRKVDKHCEGCRLDQGARFRTLASRYLCGGCYKVWMETGELPPPVVEIEVEQEVKRW